nr:hypothetical protein [Tanacetum cinerariifolium]
MARQCTQPKRLRNLAWSKEKILLVQAHEASQTNDIDAFDLDCDEAPGAKAVLMANLSSYDSTIISEVLISEPNQDNSRLDNCVQEMRYSEQPTFDLASDIEITSDSNIISYDQYLKKTESAAAQNTALTEQQNAMIMHVNESLTVELERYKERSKEKEDKYIKKEIDFEKQIKELENIVFKVGQSAQTMHMLTKPQVFYDDTHKQDLGYQNPFYLKKDQRIKPTLYDGVVISKKHDYKESFQNKRSCSNLDAPALNEFFVINDLKAQLQAKESSISKLRAHIATLKGKNMSDNNKPVDNVSVIAPGGCSKHMIRQRSQLINFVETFLGTVRSGNDHIAKIMGYSDYQIENVIISQVYYVEGLGADLLTCSRDTNLYTLSLADMMQSSPICLLPKALETKSWLWHQRLSHLNFATINELAKQGLVKGLPKPKYEKDHLFSTYSLEKSKKHTHKLKSIDSIQEKLYMLHMDFCGPMRIESINGKKYILVIVDDYSRFTSEIFLRSKDKTPEFIIKFLKMIQVRLNTSVRN